MRNSIRAKFELEHNIPEVTRKVQELANTVQTSFDKFAKTGNLTAFNNSITKAKTSLAELKAQADKATDGAEYARLTRIIKGLEQALAGAERNTRKMSTSAKQLGKDVSDAMDKGAASVTQKVRKIEREFKGMSDSMSTSIKRGLQINPADFDRITRQLNRQAGTIKGQLSKWEKGVISLSPEKVREMTLALQRIHDLQIRNIKTRSDFEIREGQRVAQATAAARQAVNRQFGMDQAGNLRSTMQSVSAMMYGGQRGPQSVAEVRQMRDRLVALSRYGPKDAASAQELGFTDPVEMQQALMAQRRFLKEREARLAQIEGMSPTRRFFARQGMNAGFNMRQGFHSLNHRITNVAQLTGTSLYGLGAIGAVSGLVTGSVRQSMEAEQQKTVLAGLINSYVKFRDVTGNVVSEQENFNRSLMRSQSLYLELRKTADESILTTREMLSYFTTAAPFGFKAGLNDKQISHVVERIGTVGSALGLRETDVTSDIRNLLSLGGRFDSTNKILLALGITGKDRDKALASGPEGFMNYFNERFKGLEPALAKFATSFTAKWSAFIDHIQQIGMTIGDNIIPSLMEGLKGLDELIRSEDFKKNMQEMGKNIGDGLNNVSGIFVKFVSFLSNSVSSPLNIVATGIVGILIKFVADMALQSKFMQSGTGAFIGGLAAVVGAIILYGNKLRNESAQQVRDTADAVQRYSSNDPFIVAEQKMAATSALQKMSTPEQFFAMNRGLTGGEQSAMESEVYRKQLHSEVFGRVNKMQRAAGLPALTEKEFDAYIAARNMDPSSNLMEKGLHGLSAAFSNKVQGDWGKAYNGKNAESNRKFARETIDRFELLVNQSRGSFAFGQEFSGIKQLADIGGRQFSEQGGQMLATAAKMSGVSVAEYQQIIARAKMPMVPLDPQSLQRKAKFEKAWRSLTSGDVGSTLPTPTAKTGGTSGPNVYRDATPADLSMFDSRLARIDEQSEFLEISRQDRAGAISDLVGRGRYGQAIGLLGDQRQNAVNRYNLDRRRIEEEYARNVAEIRAKQGVLMVGGKAVGGGTSQDWVKLKAWAEGQGFTVTGTNEKTGHNEGSKHYRGMAIDVRTRDKTPEQIAALIEKAKKEGIRVVDERTRPAGQKVWSGPHLHMEFATTAQSGAMAAIQKQIKEVSDQRIQISNELKEAERKKNHALKKRLLVRDKELAEIEKESKNMEKSIEEYRAKNRFEAINFQVDRKLNQENLASNSKIGLHQMKGWFAKMQATSEALRAEGVSNVGQLSDEGRQALQNRLNSIDAGVTDTVDSIRRADRLRADQEDRNIGAGRIARVIQLADIQSQLSNVHGYDRQRAMLEISSGNAQNFIGELQTRFNGLPASATTERSAIEAQIRTQLELIATNRRLILAIDQTTEALRQTSQFQLEDARDRYYGQTYSNAGTLDRTVSRAAGAIRKMSPEEALMKAKQMGYQGNDPESAKDYLESKLYSAGASARERAMLLDGIQGSIGAGAMALMSGGGLAGVVGALAGAAPDVLGQAIERLSTGKGGKGDWASAGAGFIVGNFLPKNSYAQEGSQIGGMLGGLLKGVGPYGAAIGILAGGLLGSLFGKKKQDPALEAYKRRIADLLSRIDKNTRPVGDYYRTKARMFQTDSAYLSGRSIGLGEVVGAG